MKAHTKQVFFELGAYCTFLGFLGVLSTIFTGMFCCLLGFSSTVYFALLGILFIAALVVSCYNMKCNSSIFKRSQ